LYNWWPGRKTIVEQISFYSDGLKLEGIFSLPPDYTQGRRVPGLVVCEGYTGRLGGKVSNVIKPLTEAGFACLLFNYRGWGGSEGERNRMICSERVEDVKSAFSCLIQRREIDPEKSGLMGFSMGGSHVVSAAAEDPRVNFVVSMWGVGDGGRWLRGMRTLAEWRAFQEEIEKDKLERVKTGKSAQKDSLEIMLLSDKERAGYLATHTPVKISLSAVESIMNYKPETVAHRIAPRPVFFVHTRAELVVAFEESVSMYRMAGSPKDLWIIPPSLVDMHFNVFKSPGPFDEVIRVVTGWIKDKMNVPG
jgi:uncharacterized protein